MICVKRLSAFASALIMLITAIPCKAADGDFTKAVCAYEFLEQMNITSDADGGGAVSRGEFVSMLMKAVGGEMHGGVAMIDVNQFKSVNDSFGHLVGDEALQTVAAAMQSCLRQTDILIRYGGDEFLLLMPQNCPDGVESVIRRVQNAVQAARVPSHPELRLSVSIGGVCNVQPLTEAIRQADARMYCNKENG